MLFSAVAFTAALAGLVAAKDISVTVGKDAKLLFVPESVNAEVGDTVTFVFYPKNHTVTQSTFKDPCTRLDGGFHSGFVQYDPAVKTPEELQTWTITVQDTKPKWAYCAQKAPANHCHKGMIFSINPDKGKKEDNSPTDAASFRQIALDLGKNDPAPSAPASAPASGAASATDASASASATGASASASATDSAASASASGSTLASASGSVASGASSASASATAAVSTGASVSKPAVSSTGGVTSTAAASTVSAPAAPTGGAVRNSASALGAAAIVLALML